MGLSSFFKGVRDFFVGREPTSTAIVKAPETAPEGKPYRKHEPAPEIPLDLMYNVQGGDNIAPDKLEEFMEKSRRRAVRHFSGKEVKHRVTHKSADTIEFVFNRDYEPQNVPGGVVRIRWVNKAA
jgi:hypothetical protein